MKVHMVQEYHLISLIDNPPQTPTFNQRQFLYASAPFEAKILMETTRVPLLKLQPCPLKGAHSYIWHNQI